MRMPPGPGTRKPRENQYPLELGVKGRKTGVTVPDTGLRDENGLEPLDGLFSSPAKPTPKSNKGKRSSGRKSVNANATLSSEEDMEIGENTVLEPTEALNKRASLRLPPPRSKSPVKTFLNSPARRHPSLGPISSPTRGSIVTSSRASVHTSVNRRLDFSKDNTDGRGSSDVSRISPQKFNRSINKLGAAPKLTNGTALKPGLRSSLDAEVEAEESELQEDPVPQEEDSYQIMPADDEDLDQEEDLELEPEPEPEPIPAKTSKKRGRPSLQKKSQPEEEPTSQSKPGRRKALRNSTDAPVEEDDNGEVEEDAEEENEEEVEEQPPAKRARGRPATVLGKKPALKARGPSTKKAKRGRPSINSPPEVRRGPPIPRNNRGLYILRREAPDGQTRTASGRNVIKPLQWWKNEHIVYDQDEIVDGDNNVFMPVIKEVLRADEVEELSQRRSRKGGHKATKKDSKYKSESEEEDEDLSEPWERKPGHVLGDIQAWDPERELPEDEQLVQTELAIAGSAIVTKEVPGSDFLYGRVFGLPFFGSGVVDLPPGAVKKQKPSGRMHLQFFVFYGRVQVTINGNTFRIGKGGVFQVPRQNTYSIANDYGKKARLFFSQGCEVEKTYYENA